MKITIFGATSLVGKYLVAKTLAAGHQVLAFGRDVDELIDKDLRNDSLRAVKGYVFEEADVAKALEGADAVLSVIGGATDGTDRSRSLGMKNIIQQMERANVQRIVALGGYGVLNDSEDHYVLDTPNYPANLKAVGQEHMLAYLFLQASALDWTFVCPVNIIDADGNGKYITDTDFKPDDGNKNIAAGDLAAFMLKELTENRFVNHRVGIVSANT